jgi:TPR repeat protein
MKVSLKSTRAFLKSLLKLSYMSIATASALFSLLIVGYFALAYVMGETACRKENVNATRTLLCQTSASLGNPVASYFVGTDYQFGERGYDIDIERAIAEYKYAADRGVADAQYSLGELLLSGQLSLSREQLGPDTIGGLKRMLEAAESGSPKALYRLAQLLFNVQAIALFKRAAAKAHAPSQFSLGLIYYLGTSVEEDEELGLFWIRKAYELGFSPAIEITDYIKSRENKRNTSSGSASNDLLEMAAGAVGAKI